MVILLLMMKKIVPFFVGFARADCGEGGDPANYGSTRRRSWGGLYSSMISRILINTLLIILRACHEYDDTLPMIDQDCCWWKRPAGDEQVQHPEHSLPEDNNLQHVSINPKIIMTIHMMIMRIPMMIMMNPMMMKMNYENYSLFVWPYTQNYRSTVLSLHFPFLCYISKISIIVSLLLNTFLNGHVFDDHGFGDCSAYICVHLTEEQSKKNTRCQCALHLQVCLLPEKSVNIIW